MDTFSSSLVCLHETQDTTLSACFFTRLSVRGYKDQERENVIIIYYSIVLAGGHCPVPMYNVRRTALIILNSLYWLIYQPALSDIGATGLK